MVRPVPLPPAPKPDVWAVNAAEACEVTTSSLKVGSGRTITVKVNKTTLLRAAIIAYEKLVMSRAGAAHLPADYIISLAEYRKWQVSPLQFRVFATNGTVTFQSPSFEFGTSTAQESFTWGPINLPNGTSTFAVYLADNNGIAFEYADNGLQAEETANLTRLRTVLSEPDAFEGWQDEYWDQDDIEETYRPGGAMFLQAAAAREAHPFGNWLNPGQSQRVVQPADGPGVDKIGVFHKIAILRAYWATKLARGDISIFKFANHMAFLYREEQFLKNFAMGDHAHWPIVKWVDVEDDIGVNKKTSVQTYMRSMWQTYHFFSGRVYDVRGEPWSLDKIIFGAMDYHRAVFKQQQESFRDSQGRLPLALKDEGFKTAINTGKILTMATKQLPPLVSWVNPVTNNVDSITMREVRGALKDGRRYRIIKLGGSLDYGGNNIQHARGTGFVSGPWESFVGLREALPWLAQYDAGNLQLQDIEAIGWSANLGMDAIWEPGRVYRGSENINDPQGPLNDHAPNTSHASAWLRWRGFSESQINQLKASGLFEEVVHTTAITPELVSQGSINLATGKVMSEGFGGAGFGLLGAFIFVEPNILEAQPDLGQIKKWIEPLPKQ